MIQEELKKLLDELRILPAETEWVEFRDFLKKLYTYYNAVEKK